MRLRKLKEKDAPYMHEWMKDQSVIEYLDNNFQNMKLEDCINFIKQSNLNTTNIHFAVVNDTDEYLGTISLKNIDREQGFAEFAIVMRENAHGKGIAKLAMEKILSYGKNTLELEKIYWCVSKNNIRAIKFYDKEEYTTIVEIPSALEKLYKDKLYQLIWYCY